MEPRVEEIDDFNDNESQEKRATVLKTVFFIFVTIAFLQGVKCYYDFHMPASFNPVIEK